MQHVVSEVPSRIRDPQVNYYDPAEAGESSSLIHHALRPVGLATTHVGLVTPHFIGVESDDVHEVLYPGAYSYPFLPLPVSFTRRTGAKSINKQIASTIPYGPS